MLCQDRQDLLLLYVSDALDASEAQEMRSHLQTGCPQCQGYLAEAHAVMTAVPLALDLVTPPPKLKQKLMQRIADHESQLLSNAQRMELKPGVVGQANPDRSGSAPMKLFRYLIPAAVAACVAVAVTHTHMAKQVEDLRQQASALRAEAETANVQVRQLEELRSQFHSQAQMVELLQSPGLKLIPLKATENQPNAVANLLWDKSSHQWAILTTGMKPAAAGQTYELWFVTEAGAKVEAGTFDVDAKGNGSLLVPIPAGLGNLKLAAVTNEKAGGVAQPAGNFQVLGSVE